MKSIRADLHVHLGATEEGKPVKITASKKMTLEGVVYTARERKGLDVVGIIDALGPRIQKQLLNSLKDGTLRELPCGGIRHKNGLTIILGGEIETQEGAHFLTYFPTIADLLAFSNLISSHITNINLSSQRAHISVVELGEMVIQGKGILLPAHAFTPHKGVYGAVVARLKELWPNGFPPCLLGVELGLSADTSMAEMIQETNCFAYLSNSDAHSLEKIAREFNVFHCREASWSELVLALKEQGGRRIIANFGINPRLGKYHRTWCPKCGYLADGKDPVVECPQCGYIKTVMGVYDRLILISDSTYITAKKNKPPYHYHVPLDLIPGIGRRRKEELLNSLGLELDIIYEVKEKDLRGIVGEKVTNNIILAREGKLPIIPGGGGKYGKILAHSIGSN
jgi:uncharacterized protein (TIGR00375 family)